ncbi:uncharacterized protein N7483_002384 [Penicillium malachiteum]|uniref:uncharacterized protein n=1 Tax=Penicillium malachiteum TaxID=1324776 RepID=UPI002547F2B4|nr:uncharacterized protein N7483_002384 [Penicillium malachiteum]KAJ5737259.1 hypothetical protein N7483_002384 [Penicillium malachiteum]
MAQNAAIRLPVERQTVVARSDLIVQILRPNSLTNSKEMAVAIGFSFCANGSCSPASENMGTVVYNGDFNPVSHEDFLPPYQNFTISVPPGCKSGKGQINVAHATLVGAELYPYIESLNQSIFIS